MSLCECGCGGTTEVVTRNYNRQGQKYSQGQSRRYIHGHNIPYEEMVANAAKGAIAAAGSGAKRRIELHGAQPEYEFTSENQSRGGKISCHNRCHLANGISKPLTCDLCAEDLAREIDYWKTHKETS